MFVDISCMYSQSRTLTHAHRPIGTFLHSPIDANVSDRFSFLNKHLFRIRRMWEASHSLRASSLAESSLSRLREIFRLQLFSCRVRVATTKGKKILLPASYMEASSFYSFCFVFRSVRIYRISRRISRICARVRLGNYSENICKSAGMIRDFCPALSRIYRENFERI